MAETQRVEIGFAGGQVVSVRLAEEPLRRAAQDGRAGVRLARPRDRRRHPGARPGKVVFVRIAGAPHTIGFSGT